MQAALLLAVAAAACTSCIAFQPLSSVRFDAQVCTVSASRYQMTMMSQPTSLIARRQALVTAAVSPLLLVPQPSSATKARKGASNGKWAQRYDEFTEEELEGFSETASG